MLTTLFSIVAFNFSAYVNGGCRFLKMGGSYMGLFRAEYMIFSRSFDNGYGFVTETKCGSMTNGPTSLKVSQAFGIMAALLGGIIMCLSISQFCLKLPSKLFYGGSIALVFCCIFQLITFSVFASCHGSCSIGRDGILSIFAAFFYLAAAFTMFLIPKNNPPSDNNEVVRENLLDTVEDTVEETVEETPELV